MTRTVVNLQTGEQQIIPLTQEEIDEINSRPSPPRIIPTVKAWQAKAAIEANGLTATVQAAIEALPEGIDKIRIKSKFDNNADFSITDAGIQSLAAEIGIDQRTLENLFLQAAAFE